MQPYKSFSRYLEVEKGRAEKTIAAYLGDIQRFRKWLDLHPQDGLALSWEQVRPRHIRAYLADLDKSPNYIHRVTSSLRVWFDFLSEIEELRDDNPAREIAKPKKGARYPNTLSLEEAKRLIKAAVEYSRIPERLRNWTLITFILGTGLRISEVCNLKVSDVRHKDGLPHSLKVIGKGDKERTVVLSKDGQRALHQWLKERQLIVADMGLGGHAHYVWLIPAGRKRGRRLEPQGVREVLKRLAPLAGIKKSVYPHLLRHTFATEAVRAGARIHGLQAVLGHASLATTSIYLHADQAELEAVADVMPGVLDA